MCNIIQEPHKTLRKQADPVKKTDLGSQGLITTISHMVTALHREPDGVALAAPQINVSSRIFIIAGFVFDLKKKNIGGTPSPDRVFINPEIIKSSKETKWMPGEGCLSVRWIYGTTKRFKNITVRALDSMGKSFTMEATGLLAQIIQHEIDHLNGILFIDHAKDIRPMTEEEIEHYKKDIERIAAQRNPQPAVQ